MTIVKNESLEAEVERMLRENRSAIAESERRARIREREFQRISSSISRALMALRRAGIAK